MIKITSNRPELDGKINEILSEKYPDAVASAEININFSEYVNTDRLNSLWYGGETARFDCDGFSFTFMACGDVIGSLYDKIDNYRITRFKDKNNGGRLENEINNYINNDAELRAALDGKHEKYELNLDYGNWWDCEVTNLSESYQTYRDYLDDDNLLEAIAAVIAYADDWIEHTND